MKKSPMPKNYFSTDRKWSVALWAFAMQIVFYNYKCVLWIVKDHMGKKISFLSFHNKMLTSYVFPMDMALSTGLSYSDPRTNNFWTHDGLMKGIASFGFWDFYCASITYQNLLPYWHISFSCCINVFNNYSLITV